MKGARLDIFIDGLFLFDGIIPNSDGKQVEREYESQRDLVKSCVVHPLRFYPRAIYLQL